MRRIRRSTPPRCHRTSQGRGQRLESVGGKQDKAPKEITIAQAKPQKADRLAKRQKPKRSQEIRGGHKNDRASPERAKSAAADTRKWERQNKGTGKPVDSVAMSPASPPIAAPAGGVGANSSFAEASNADQITDPQTTGSCAISLGQRSIGGEKDKKCWQKPEKSSRKATPVKFIAVTSVGMIVERVERELDRNRYAFGGCPSGSGQIMMVYVDVMSDGKPRKVKIDDTPQATAKCIERIVKGMRFPAKKGSRSFTFGVAL